MYRIGQRYKFELPKSIFYTGKVLEEDSFSVKILSKFGEELVLSKEKIIQAILIKGGEV